MSMLIGFGLFLAGVAVCLTLDLSLIYAMCLGLGVFALLGKKSGHTLRAMLAMAWAPAAKMLPVLVIYGLIGCITALWRSSGTIAFCIYHGLRLITPHLFILIAFLLTSAISFALGTSFGVVGTAGVILMALGRSGGVDAAVTAGVVLAGAYCGDRCSNASSSAALVAAATDTRLEDNVKMMLRTGALPFILSAAVYGLLSWRHPIAIVDGAILDALREGFSLSLWTLLPPLLLLGLPLLHLSIRLAMAASAVSALCVTVLCQHAPVPDALWTALAGYTPAAEALRGVMSGGGAVSMLTASVLMLCTAMFAGLLDGLGGLETARRAVAWVVRHYGRFPAVTAAMTLCAMVFCNQSTGAVVTPGLVADAYADAAPGELAQDMENSGVVIAPLIPWNISVSIPLLMLGATARAIPYAVLLYAIPLCYGLTKKYFYPPKEKKI